MDVPARCAAAALVLAFLGASLSPCPDQRTGPSHERQADHAGSAEQGHHPPDCAEASRPALSPACPCGCGEREPASPGARLGHALLAAPPSLERLALFVHTPVESPAFPDPPRRAIDHVPLAA